MEPGQEPMELVFVTISGRRFAVPAAEAEEVVAMVAPTPVPAWPETALGVIDLRGTLVPLIDVGLFLGRPPAAIDPRQFILVVRAEQRPWAFVIEQVEAVRAEEVLPADRLAPPEALSASPLCLGMVQDSPEPIAVLAPHGIWERLRLPSGPQGLPGTSLKTVGL